MTRALRKIATGLASLWLTLACLVGAAAIALGGPALSLPVSTWVALPFGLLFVNLMAALATSPKLRRQGGLLGFHLALAGLALLVAVDRLMSFNGHVEITEGTAFDAALVTAEAGPLHPWTIDRIDFVQEGFDINYGPEVKRRETFSTVRVRGEDGAWRRRVVGDDKPLVFGDYRFYTSFNKGFAPVLTYLDARGQARSGSIHLPSYPLNYYKQGNEWALPDGSASVKLWLHLPEPVYRETEAWRFRKPEQAVLVVIGADGRRELRPGDTVPVGDGRLRYDELRSWMGYTISYNPLMSWMLAAAATGVLCLAWHAGVKMARVPWQVAPRRERAGDAA